MDKIIKSARFLAEDENGFVIGEADTYEEAQAFGGTVIDTQGNQEEGGLFQSKKVIKSAADNSYVYMVGMTPAEWTKQDAIAAIKNHVTNYGYYRLGDNEGLCLVGRYEDIVNFIENYVGVEVVDDYMCPYSSFDWDDAEKLDMVNSSRRPIKSSMSEELEEALADLGNAESDFELVGLVEDILNKHNMSDKYSDFCDEIDATKSWRGMGKIAEKYIRMAIKSSRRPEKSIITNSRKLETEVVRKLLSGKISEEGAVRIIATSKKCGTGYARQILSRWLEERSPSLIKSGLADVRSDINKVFDVDGNIDSWSAEYVPQSGKASTKGGEILRAFNVIQCAWFNHGERVGKGKDKELLNSAANFLKDHSDEKTSKIIDNAFRCKDIESYDNAVESMKLTLSNFLCNNSDLFESANDEDMLDYYEEQEPEDTVDKIELTDEETGTSWKFSHNGENSWVCEDVETDSELAEGDTFTEGSGFEDEVDKTAEFGTFTKDGVEYEYEATGEPDENNEYHDWEITKAVPEENICDEGQEVSGDEIIGYMNDGYECHIEVDEEPTEEQLRS